MDVQTATAELSKIFEVNVFLNDFACAEDVAREYSVEPSTLDPLVIISADYTYEDYSGDSSVYYFDTTDNNFYEVHGGHCSCHGLEGQWEPELIGELSLYLEYRNR